MSLPIVALIGQTNAGKSSLLNRLAKKNIAIVAREEGTTRDNVSARIDDRFLLVDTAGLKNPEDSFEASIQDQISDAIDSASLILLVLDSTLYPSEKDKRIAKMALKSKKPVFLLLNKSDRGDSLDFSEFRSLGIKEENSFRTSATTGAGIVPLKERITYTLSAEATISSRNLPQATAEGEVRATPATAGGRDGRVREGMLPQALKIKLALIGRPNVGKSSLFNSLSKKQQALVSSRQGTTRDVNRVEIKFKGKTLEILDTAGLRKPGKREVGIEKFSALRTFAAIEEADVCALLLDATEPHSKLDQTLAGEIVKKGKGIIVILNKTDLVSSEKVQNILDDLESDFNFIPYAPVLIASAKTGENVTKLFELALEIDANRHLELKTSDLNKILNSAIINHAPAGLNNSHPKPKYIVQTDTCPPWFIIHGHNLKDLHWSWKRYLENTLRESVPFVGTPIFFSFRDDK